MLVLASLEQWKTASFAECFPDVFPVNYYHLGRCFRNIWKTEAVIMALALAFLLSTLSLTTGVESVRRRHCCIQLAVDYRGASAVTEVSKNSGSSPLESGRA